MASATDGFNPGEICSIEHAQDSLVEACTVVSIGVSDIGVAMMGNKKALFNSAFLFPIIATDRFEVY
jgi:hypothetical protein